jgi:PIN domain nuclease of toxin-antitoxin system
MPVASRQLIESADLCLSSVTIYEIAQKVRLGKWTEMAPFTDDLLRLPDQQRTSIISVTPQIALEAALLDWPHRDPFDRLIAATALVMGCALISADPCFDTLPSLRRIWE